MHRLVVCLAAVVAAHAATPLFQTSFEKPNQGWTAVRGAAAPDSAVTHNNNRSLRVEGVKNQPDVAIRFAPVALTIGKRYELSGWVRTEDLAVRDLDRTPIATGAALTMASMPFDVHSASLGGTQPWTRLSLRFVASRAQDAVLFTVADGGTFLRGKAWVEGVSLDEVSTQDEWPIRDAVQTFGPAYRYPAAGWIYLHIEGQPYERGYQHGHLMAREIPEYLARCAADLGSADEWNEYRTSANALFLRGFDREILEEMRGIADGAADAGARWQNRRVDLLDIVVANVTVEMGELRSAVNVTPTGLEGLSFDKPSYGAKRDSVMDHCSAFAATGPATRDGKMVIGHVTWWPLTLAEQHQRDARHPAHLWPPVAHAELSGRHRERHRLVSERRRRGAHRNHHPPDALQRARHAGGVPRTPGHSIRRQYRRGGGEARHAQQRPVHQRMADRRR